MRTVVVTGYVPLPCSHRGRDTYEALGKQLMQCVRDGVAFRQELESCWLYKQLRQQGCTVEPGGKDTPAYHCVQHEKSAWLAMAARAVPDATLVWIDYGILHNRAIRPQHIVDFIHRVSASPPAAITAPSCGVRVTSDNEVNWTFCGGVLVMPAGSADWFHQECRLTRNDKPPTWEVNTWSAVRASWPERFRLYDADHNETIFTGIADLLVDA